MSERLRSPRVVIVSDPLVQRGGAERVVEAIADAFPDAPIYAIMYSRERGPASLAPRIRTSYLQRIPGAVRRHRAFFPLFPSAIESLDLSDFDVVVSSHHSVAKGLLRNSDQFHLCYCHTPMRALWERSAAEIATLPMLARPAAAALLSRIRVWDLAAAARVDSFVANSRVTQARISRHYRRSSVILNPPIDIERFVQNGKPAPSATPYYLVASRAVPYKRVDVAVAAARAAGRRVVVVGGNHPGLPDDPEVVALGVVDDERLVELMRCAEALICPQYEDFGMAPLEMNACGRPTIALAAGGALETVIDGTTGILVQEQTPEAFAHGIRLAETIRFDPVTLRAHAESFSRSRFIKRLREIVFEGWERHLKS